MLLPDRAFVELEDTLFSLHGLGPRYALVQNTDQGDLLSYATLDLPGSPYDLITHHDQPRVLGAFEQLVQASGVLHSELDAAFKADRSTGRFASKQQMGLALIRASADGIDPDDQLAVLRTVRWAKRYELRADWLTRHRVEAFAVASIDWQALELG